METKRPRVVPHRGVEGGEARLPSLLDSRRRPRVTNRPFNHECLRSFLALMGRPSCLAANAVAGRPISRGFDGFCSSLELGSISSFALGGYPSSPFDPILGSFSRAIFSDAYSCSRSSFEWLVRREEKKEEDAWKLEGRSVFIRKFRKEFCRCVLCRVREIGK